MEDCQERWAKYEKETYGYRLNKAYEELEQETKKLRDSLESANPFYLKVLDKVRKFRANLKLNK